MKGVLQAARLDTFFCGTEVVGINILYQYFISWLSLWRYSEPGVKMQGQMTRIHDSFRRESPGDVHAKVGDSDICRWTLGTEKSSSPVCSHAMGQVRRSRRRSGGE